MIISRNGKNNVSDFDVLWKRIVLLYSYVESFDNFGYSYFWLFSMDGFRVTRLEEVVKNIDILITCSGRANHQLSTRLYC